MRTMKNSKPSKFALAGRVLTALVAAPFLFSIYAKISGSPEVTTGWSHLGWELVPVMLVATLEIGSLLLYLFPKTAMLGAILLTGYLGGAIGAHLRVEESVVFPAVLGMLIWGALYLRDARLRALIPIRE